ncbi:MAG: TatD family hydrolase [Elusimicrobiales bacterium]|nr:TatD family hydrolase [Elusimicrobiales bacterium]HOL61951.1 TatD family hydrolase [Elusimicrobiales bacterium]HPO95167.1 TatD family hydrolase [Elusimicrobiales bacterium]
MIDSHTHLSDEKFDSDRTEVIKKSISLGVNIFLEVLCSEKEWDRKKYFDSYPDNFYFSFGIHPHYTDENTLLNLEELKRQFSDPKCVAVGEIGLDLWYYPDKIKDQLSLLENQIYIANELNKPTIFHIRNSKSGNDAYYEFFNFIKGKIKKRGIIHSFSSGTEDAKKAADMGFLIGVNATITYPKNHELRQALKTVGIDKILCETDSPYLPPQRIRGKRNDPLSVKDIIQSLSLLTDERTEKIEEKISKNFFDFINQ